MCVCFIRRVYPRAIRLGFKENARHTPLINHLGLSNVASYPEHTVQDDPSPNAAKSGQFLQQSMSSAYPVIVSQESHVPCLTPPPPTWVSPGVILAGGLFVSDGHLSSTSGKRCRSFPRYVPLCKGYALYTPTAARDLLRPLFMPATK